MSPIEAQFADAMLGLIQENPWGVEVKFVGQVPIGPFRVDFLLQSDAACVVVECDGHPWHERTKEQAARDRERDRMLLRAGYPVVRFTGSEIYRDSLNCADEALETLVMLEAQ